MSREQIEIEEKNPLSDRYYLGFLDTDPNDWVVKIFYNFFVGYGDFDSQFSVDFLQENRYYNIIKKYNNCL